MSGVTAGASVRYTPRQQKDGYCFLTYKGEAASTVALTPALNVDVHTGMIKCTVMSIIRQHMRVKHAATAFFQLTASPGVSTQIMVAGNEFEFTNCSAIDFTPSVVARATSAVHTAESAYQEFFRANGLTYGHPLASQYVHRRMMDGEFPPGTYVPSVEGYSQTTSLNNMGENATRHAWAQCVAIAKVVTGFDETCVKHVVPTQECLFICALRIIAGHYPPQPEDADDRVIRHMRMYTNTDCDDMMVTCAALFHRMQSIDWSPHAGAFEPEGLAFSCMREFVDVRCCIGMVDLAVGNPNATGESLIGHVWGCVVRHDGTALHVESTRTTQCHAGEPSALYGKGVFVTGPSGRGCEATMQVLHADRYKLLCSVFTATSTMVVCSGRSVGCAYTDYIAGKCQEIPLPTDGSMDTELDAYRHQPCAGCMIAVHEAVPVSMQICKQGAGCAEVNCPLSCPAGQGFGRPSPHSTSLVKVMPSLYWALNKSA